MFKKDEQFYYSYKELLISAYKLQQPRQPKVTKMEELKENKMHLKNDDVEVEEDDDRPMLSSQALAALQEFLSEQNQTSETAQNKTESDSDEVALVSEDWRLSQFWYDAVTAETVAQEAVSLCSDSDSRVACIACPTLYAYLKVIYWLIDYLYVFTLFFGR